MEGGDDLHVCFAFIASRELGSNKLISLEFDELPNKPSRPTPTSRCGTKIARYLSHVRHQQTLYRAVLQYYSTVLENDSEVDYSTGLQGLYKFGKPCLTIHQIPGQVVSIRSSGSHDKLSLHAVDCLLSNSDSLARSSENRRVAGGVKENSTSLVE